MSLLRASGYLQRPTGFKSDRGIPGSPGFPFSYADDSVSFIVLCIDFGKAEKEEEEEEVEETNEKKKRKGQSHRHRKERK